MTSITVGPQDEKKPKKTISEKIKKLRDNITVEPMISAFIVPVILCSLAIQNLNLDKACRVNLNYGDEICDKLIVQKDTQNYTKEEAEVQKLVANMTAWKVPLQTAIPAFLLLFIGAWSDRTGRRKPCMTTPILGDLITAIGLILCTYYFYEWPLEVAGVLEGLPPALLGGQAVVIMGVISYLAENTTPEERTFRIGVANMFITLSLPIGLSLSGILLKTIGYYGVFSVAIVCYIGAYTYGMLRIKDKNVKKDIQTHWYSLASCSSVVDTFNVATKKRLYKKRRRIILVILSIVSIQGSTHGSMHLNYLFARKRHHFTEVEFSIFAAYGVMVQLFGVLFALTILSKKLKMDDNLLAALACSTKFISSFMLAFAPTKAWFYTAPLIEFLYAAAGIAVRSIATKLIQEDELGKMNSLVGVCEAAMSTIYSPIFSLFYANTVESFPGAYHILAAGLKLPAIVIFMYLYKLQKWENSQTQMVNKLDDDPKINAAYDNDIKLQ